MPRAIRTFPETVLAADSEAGSGSSQGHCGRLGRRRSDETALPPDAASPSDERAPKPQGRGGQRGHACTGAEARSLSGATDTGTLPPPASPPATAPRRPPRPLWRRHRDERRGSEWLQCDEGNPTLVRPRPGHGAQVTAPGSRRGLVGPDRPGAPGQGPTSQSGTETRVT